MWGRFAIDRRRRVGGYLDAQSAGGFKLNSIARTNRHTRYANCHPNRAGTNSTGCYSDDTRTYFYYTSYRYPGPGWLEGAAGCAAGFS